MWIVGDGWTIGVTTHKWLPHKPIFLGEQQLDLWVQDLIDRDTMQWDREKIFDLFPYSTRMEILSIPLRRITGQDVLIWKETKSGTFSVKSAYQVATRMAETSRTEHSTATTDRPYGRNYGD